jgi:rSAM/selenodomain-associated transferase 2
MCRSLLSVDWQGDLYDCDFNQMLGLRATHRRPGAAAPARPAAHDRRRHAHPRRRPLLRLHRRPGQQLRRGAGGSTRGGGPGGFGHPRLKAGCMPRLSVVVPVLDEAAGIGAALQALAPLRAAGHEVIVVDGGSQDATATLAAPLANAVLHSPRGRARQMNTGAAAAQGDVLLFLHADTTLPEGAATAVLQALQGGARWGRFDVAISGRSRWLPVVALLMNLRSRATGIATGDQALFVQTALFRQAGALCRTAADGRHRALPAPARPGATGLPAAEGGHLRPALGPARRLAHHRADVAAALALLAR